MKTTLIILAHAFVAWAVCAAIMGVGLAVWTVEATVITHAIAVPFIFALVSLVYFRWFALTSPLQTALIFAGFALLIDLFVVALLIMRSFEMFRSPLGTWIPIATMFLSTYLIGTLVGPRVRSERLA